MENLALINNYHQGRMDEIAKICFTVPDVVVYTALFLHISIAHVFAHFFISIFQTNLHVLCFVNIEAIYRIKI